MASENVLNGGFETGDFTGWETIGNAIITDREPIERRVVTITTISPTQGNFQALIANSRDIDNPLNPLDSVSDDSLESFLGLNPSAIDNLDNGDAIDGSALKKQITVNAGDVLSFDFNFVTLEISSDAPLPSEFNDFAFVSISRNFVAELADTGSVLFPPPIDFPTETDYDNFTFKFTEAGTYTVGIGVVNAKDSDPRFSSVIFVDNFNVFDASEAILGTDEGESLFGTVSNDAIFGKGGDDQIFGSEGVNHLYGGDGDDLIFGGSQADTIYGGRGNDTIFAAEGNNIVFGGAGDDTIYTGSGNDTIDGGFGNNTIWLGGGQDVVILEPNRGTDTINNFQLGSSRFFVGSLLNDLSFADSNAGVRISVGNDLLAVVAFQSASTFSNNVGSIFVV